MSKKTFEAVEEAKGELVVQIKGNQRELQREVAEACDYLKPISCYDAPIEKERNRIEQRTTETFDVRTCLVESGDWNRYIACIIRVKRHTEIFDTEAKLWKTRKEFAYYASSHWHDAKCFADSIRKHWYTENCNHYVRDVSLYEDGSRIRRNAGVFARLRSFALNILRFEGITNIKGALFENALDFGAVVAMRGIMI